MVNRTKKINYSVNTYSFYSFSVKIKLQLFELNILYYFFYTQAHIVNVNQCNFSQRYFLQSLTLGIQHGRHVCITYLYYIMMRVLRTIIQPRHCCRYLNLPDDLSKCLYTRYFNFLKKNYIF